MSYESKNTHVRCEFTRFDVVARYTCPVCGNVEDVKVDAGGVYWMIEASDEHECPECHAELNLTAY